MNIKFLALIAIIMTASLVSAAVLQESMAASKEQKYTQHCKQTFDPDTFETIYKCGSNDNGPFGHLNCKYGTDRDTGEFYSNCK